MPSPRPPQLNIRPTPAMWQALRAIQAALARERGAAVTLKDAAGHAFVVAAGTKPKRRTAR